MISESILAHAICEFNLNNKDQEIYNYCIYDDEVILYHKHFYNKYSGYYICRSLEDIDNILRGCLSFVRN